MGNARRVLLIGLFPFTGEMGGPAARLRNIALALSHGGMMPTMFQTGETNCAFDWNSIPVRSFEAFHLGTPETRQRWKLCARANRRPFEAMAHALREECKSGAFAGVIFYNQDLQYGWKVASLCRQLGMPYIQQYAEQQVSKDFPRGVLSSGFWQSHAALQLLPRVSDGSLVISTQLSEWVARRASHEVLLLPTITRIPPSTARVLSRSPHLVCISGGGRRDDLATLFQGMATVLEKGGSSRLTVVGLTPSSQGSAAALANRLGASSRIRLHGFVDRQQFDSIVMSADATILLRTDDASTRGSFPSRLHELLASGAPAVLSRVGDLPRYFTDGVDCLFVRASDSNDLASRLLWLESHPKESSLIGLRGNARGREAFAPSAHSTRLCDYISAVGERRRTSIAGRRGAMIAQVAGQPDDPRSRRNP